MHLKRLLIALPILVSAEVHRLTQATFTPLIEQHDTVLVNFGVPWCGHCKLLEPHYEIAAAFLADHNVVLATVDCTTRLLEEDDLCHDIKAYPTLRIYHGTTKSFEPYEGRRKSSDDIISAMTNGAFPTSSSQNGTNAEIHKERPAIYDTPLDISPDSTAPNAILTAEDSLSALVKLALPGLSIPLSSSAELSYSSSLLLNFSVSDSGKHLLLNGELLALRVPDPSRPRLISAPQVPLTSNITEQKGETFTNYVELDYEFWANNRDDPNIIYYNYYPKIYLNLIGARVSEGKNAFHDILLDSLDQKYVEIQLHDPEARPSGDPNVSYTIIHAKLLDRAADYVPPHPDDKPCSRWSWRCADFGDPPWYRYIWRQNFDEYGRIGSMRRNVLMRWKRIKDIAWNMPWTIQAICVLALGYKIHSLWRNKGKRQLLLPLWQTKEPQVKKSVK
ncbi:hypothetical protein CKM354_001080600 [Cercospora kikuchii]|uniref:Thioredoxin domain-containing protein n=1 Tax=Cercospora kikuchii TaxID=84275 RepID=A0A9P3CS99_9PEZI|nr:uncharacterized protein CKM354_001080600 [Cercospora kikuchii]GIZ47721.1 hypothetical protein CKM354_001080600 [Cercospora kikuchii]